MGATGRPVAGHGKPMEDHERPMEAHGRDGSPRTPTGDPRKFMEAHEKLICGPWYANGSTLTTHGHL